MFQGFSLHGKAQSSAQDSSSSSMFTRSMKQSLLGLLLFMHCSGLLSYTMPQHYHSLTSLKGLNSDYEKIIPVRENGGVDVLRSVQKVSMSIFAAYSLLSSSNHNGANAATSSEKNPLPTPNKGFQTKSGLKYFDFVEGKEGSSPKYGQLVSFHYTGYYRATPESRLDLFDATFSPTSKQSFLHKHGNGRVIRGIDEALHTMRVGGKRRVIIPKNIGYERFGMGPVPTEPSDRRKLGKLLDLLELDKGELIFDLELVLVADDENDQGNDMTIDFFYML